MKTRLIQFSAVILSWVLVLFAYHSAHASSKNANSPKMKSKLDNAVVLRPEPKNQIVANFDQTGSNVIKASVVEAKVPKPDKVSENPNALTGKDKAFRDMMKSWKKATSETFSEEDCRKAGLEDCDYQKRADAGTDKGSRVLVS